MHRDRVPEGASIYGVSIDKHTTLGLRKVTAAQYVAVHPEGGCFAERKRQTTHWGLLPVSPREPVARTVMTGPMAAGSPTLRHAPARTATTGRDTGTGGISQKDARDTA
jgi:hypothetical protein